MTFLITGCSRGIGLELTTQALALGHKVFACVRDSKKSLELNALTNNFPTQLAIVTLDTTSDDSAIAAAKTISEPIDILINNAGVYLDGKANSLSEVSSQMVLDTFQTNTLGPIRVTKAFSSQLSKSQSPKVLNISSLMGSIDDNAGGGSYAYRMSKTALNMFSKCLSIEFPKMTVLSLHPGWVQTDMGGKGATTSISDSARGILDIALNAQKAETAKFYDFNKRELAW